MPLTADEIFASYTARRGDIRHSVKLTAKLAVEIAQVAGCAADVAQVAAGAFVNCRNDPDFGLSATASKDPGRTMAASFALAEWIADVERRAMQKAA